MMRILWDRIGVRIESENQDVHYTWDEIQRLRALLEELQKINLLVATTGEMIESDA